MDLSKVSEPELIDLDYVMVNELGEFGKYQLFHNLLVFIPMIISAFPYEYIFSAAAINHRCRITECGEVSKLGNFEPEWVLDAIPAIESSNDFESCYRYPSVDNGTLDYCPAYLFNQNERVTCDGFVYETSESVVYDFDLGCREWYRALAGILNSVGTLIAQPIAGYVSDRWGRRLALIISVFNLGLFGVIRAFSVNYPMYLALQIIQTTLGAGTYTAAYLISAELTGPKWRVLVSATSSGMFAIGEMVLGGTAWAVPNWRLLLLILHVPCFLIIIYHWVLAESVRWLISKKKFEEAEVELKKFSRMNKKELSEKSLEALLTPASPPTNSTTQAEDSLIKAIFKSRILLRRVMTTPVWWITTTLVFYGLSINSAVLSSQIHLNYILTVAIEIPGNYSSLLFLDRFGRRPTLCWSFALTGVCNIVFAFLPMEMTVLRLVIYLFSKFSISIVYTALYLYTSELYPTQYRHTLIAFSLMVGSMGNVAATFMPALMQYWSGIPSVIFGSMSLLSAVLSLTQPETVGTNLPDTLAEAEALGQS